MKLPFLSLFARCLTDRGFYRTDLRARRGTHAVQYLYFLLLVISVLALARQVVTLSGLSLGAPLIEQQKTVLRELYPPELVVRIQSGSVTTNVKEPYAIPMPDQWKRWLDGDGKTFKNLVVIDTEAPADDYPDRATLVLVTKRALVHPSRRNGEVFDKNYEVTPLDTTVNLIIDKDSYQDAMAAILPFVDQALGWAKGFFVMWVLVGPFVTAAVKLAWYALYLVFTSLVLWIIDITILKKNLRFQEMYRLSYYGLTLPLVITFAFAQLGIAAPLLFTGLLIGWMWYVFADFPKATPASEKAA
jgi:hypothetical protein